MCIILTRDFIFLTHPLTSIYITYTNRLYIDSDICKSNMEAIGNWEALVILNSKIFGQILLLSKQKVSGA